MKETLREILHPIWISSQTDLCKVIRWKECLNDGIGKNMRPQSTLHHSLSFSIVADAAVLHMQPHIKVATGKTLDEALLQRTFKIHDLGEGFTGRDILAPFKTDYDDLAEYLKFKEFFGVLPLAIYAQYEYAFLLQFALKNPSCFPEDARKIMRDIQKNHYLEALAFKALEKWEYLFYAFEMEKNHPYLLTWVMRHHISAYQDFAKELPGFREEVFTIKTEEEILNYLLKHTDVPKQAVPTSVKV